MKIKDMFQKDIGRPIQGVVKIGQDSTEMIATELDEYVVTKELHRHFDKFFEGYRKGTKQRTDKIGVWISGFFGSGKSHFLKIISYLLGGELYDGKKAITYFDGKITDSRIMADIQLASDTNTDVILFNIDAEAGTDAQSNKDPIVKVFMKVFNKMQGFCSAMPWVADLERQMVKEGVYDDFRACFKEISGSVWEEARNDLYFEQDNIIKALSESTRMSVEAAHTWYSKAGEEYSLDINSFARRVREYIEAKEAQTGKKQFVVFLADEVGQYIGSSGSLMLNLQNIVEGLGNECGGRAWVIATGQEDIDSITNVNRDAFSKIIGRFDTRLSLSSANVDEVIKKRLLAKKDSATDKLRLLYEEKFSIIKSLIFFSPDTPEKRLYDSADEFAEVYPFIPYQFNLLQAVFNGIRTHGASGKHLSEGERSLLNAFQEAALQYVNFDDGTLIPFDAFYRTVETFLDHNIRRVIISAEESASREDGALQPYDVEVLKTLFMIKYIPNVLPANFENIATIMLQNIDEDKITVKKTIDASLRRLESQKLITQNGDQFIFLTNEEQDINREIREIRIDQKELVDKVGNAIFNVLFGLTPKYRHNERHDFSFNTLIDDRPIGTQKDEIGIRVLTPIYAHGSMDESAIKIMSMGERNIIVALPPNTDFLDEMEQSMQIDAFMRRHSGKTSTDSIEDIKTTKSREGKQRAARCRELIVEALKKASIYVNSIKLDIREKAPEQRINDAFKKLVDSIFSKQGYITKPFLTTESLRELLEAKENTQITLDGHQITDPNHLAISDMTDVIERSYYKNIMTTMRSISEQFSKMPYGWQNLDIAGIVLTLFKKQKIRLELSGENITATDDSIIDYVTKREYLDRLTVKWRDIISPALIQNAKEVAQEVFGRGDLPNDEDGLMARIKDYVAAELMGNTDSIKDLLHEYTSNRYPGKQVLESGKKLLEQVERFKDTKSFYEYLHSEKDALLDYEEDVRDIKKFFKTQKTIFDNALKKLDVYEGNRAYVLDSETIGIITSIEKISKLTSPYSEIHKLPELIEQFAVRFSELLQKERASIQASIEADRDVTLADLSRRFMQFADEGQASKTRFESLARTEYGALLDRLSHASNIYEAIAMQTESDRMKQRYIQNFIDEELRLAQMNEQDNDMLDAPVRKSITVTMKSLLAGATKTLNSEEDIDQMLGDMRIKLKAQLEVDTTIHIIS